MKDNIINAIKPFFLTEKQKELFPENEELEQKLIGWLKNNTLTEEQLIRFMVIGFFPDYRACVHLGKEFSTAPKDNENAGESLRAKNELFNQPNK